MSIFFEIHKEIPREGPGDNESTIRAYKTLKNLSNNPQILDIGCGPGMQTVELAKNIDGKIYALDLHKPFLERLNEYIVHENLEEKIETVNGSMFSLKKHFKKESFDLIWSEGAIFIMGFKEALNSWKPFLKEEGYIVVSELAWVKDNPPKEVKDYWHKEYPMMNTVQWNIETIEKAGYEVIDHFAIPESSWIDNYYIPIEKRLVTLREKYSNNEDAIKEINQSQKEIDIFRKYSEYYGYVFFIMKVK